MRSNRPITSRMQWENIRHFWAPLWRNDGPGRKRFYLIPMRGVNQGGRAARSILPGDEGRGHDAVLDNATNNVQRQNQPIQQARVRLTVCSQCATTPRSSGWPGYSTKPGSSPWRRPTPDAKHAEFGGVSHEEIQRAGHRGSSTMANCYMASLPNICLQPSRKRGLLYPSGSRIGSGFGITMKIDSLRGLVKCWTDREHNWGIQGTSRGGPVEDHMVFWRMNWGPLVVILRMLSTNFKLYCVELTVKYKHHCHKKVRSLWSALGLPFFRKWLGRSRYTPWIGFWNSNPY